jgi:hypothetical protein
VDETATLRVALDELAFSEIKSVPVRARTTGEILGFFDAAIGVRAALEAAENGEGPDVERLALEKHVNDVINPSLVSGARGDGGSVPFACADLPLRELVSEHGYLLYEQHCDEPIGKGQSGSWWFNAEVHRLCVVDSRVEASDASPPEPATPREKEASTEPRYDAFKAHGASQRFPRKKPKWEEIIDVVSQMDVVRCLVYAADIDPRIQSPEEVLHSEALRRALNESVLKHASRPFCTFQDAPLGGVYREMLDKGYGAACVVRLAKWTLEHAGDRAAWRAIDTLSFSDFASPNFADNRRAVAALREPREHTMEDLDVPQDFGTSDDPDDAAEAKFQNCATFGGHTVGSFLANARDRGSAIRVDAVDENATVADAARLMLDKREHRAWILDANDTPVGVLTCTDILRCVATAVGRFEREDRLRRAVRDAVADDADADADGGGGGGGGGGGRPIIEEAA